MNELKSGYYRVSAKGLIWDEAREKFAIILEDNGWWELPGGGLDHGESHVECLKRELMEECGLTVTEVGANPLYYMVGKNMKGRWSVNLVFEIKVKDLNFTKSEECVEIKFVTPDEAISMHSWRNVKELAELIKKDKRK